MKMLVVVAMQLGWTLYPPLSNAQISITEEPSAALKSCISTNAPGVERAIEPLGEATDFLVKKICLGALTDQVIDRNKRESELQKAQTDAMCKEFAAKPKPAPKPDDPLGEFDDDYYLRMMCEPASGLPLPDYASIVGDSLFLGDGAITAPRVEALAAQTLLKLRVERLNRKP